MYLKMSETSSKTEAEVKEDIRKIKEWMSKQPHMPGNLEDEILGRFLHSCHYGLENTKRCIENFYTIRSETPELFTNRDPLSKELQIQFGISHYCTTFSKSGKRMYTFWQLNDPSLSSYVFFDSMKSFFMVADCWLLEDRTLEEEDVVIIDVKGIPLKIITVVNLSTLKRCFAYLLGDMCEIAGFASLAVTRHDSAKEAEALPTRLTEIHLINCPPYMDKLFAFVRPFLPPEVCQIIHFHQPDSQVIYQHVEKESIPLEFGGTGPKARDIMDNWLTLINKHREFYLNDSAWIADESKRMKKKYAEEIDLMKGSFRALCVD